MTLRVTQVLSEKGTTLRVAGDVTGGEVAELEECYRTALPPVTIDLQGVMTVDELGLAVLNAAAADGARLVGASPYIAMKLGEPTDFDPDPRLKQKKEKS